MKNSFVLTASTAHDRKRCFISQVKYYTDCHKVYNDLSHRLNQNKEDITSEEYDQNMQQKLNEIKALSIVDDD